MLPSFRLQNDFESLSKSKETLQSKTKMLLNSLKMKEKELETISSENSALLQEIADVKADSQVTILIKRCLFLKNWIHIRPELQLPPSSLTFYVYF